METQNIHKNAGEGCSSRLAVLVRSIKGIPFVEGLRLTNEKNLVIASNARLTKALVGSNEWKGILEAFPGWTSTMTAHAKPGEKLGAAIEYVDSETKEKWVFPVPKEFQNERNAILVAEHPDYRLESDGKNIVVHATVVDLIPDFPIKTEGWYRGDTKHHIPTGREFFFPQDVVENNVIRWDIFRHLWRMEKRVGPVGRDHSYNSSHAWYDIQLGCPPSYPQGVAVEAED